MKKEDKLYLKRKYGYSKILYFIHLLGRYCKELYHPERSKRPQVFGKGNIITFIPQGVQIEIYGENNKIEIAPSVKKWKGIIACGDIETPVYNCHIKIGENSDANGVNIIVMEDNTTVTIGDNCMFSWGIWLFASDTHTIYDVKTKKLQNWGKEIVISDNVWLAMDCTILKNSFIAKNCVVGASAVVSGKFTEENCVIAGNPAKVVKRGVAWDRRRPKEYIKEYPLEKNPPR